jgi:hypothetical protein
LLKREERGGVMGRSWSMLGDGGRAVVTGEIDLAAEADLRRILAEAGGAAGPGTVTVDMAG